MPMSGFDRPSPARRAICRLRGVRFSRRAIATYRSESSSQDASSKVPDAMTEASHAESWSWNDVRRR